MATGTVPASDLPRSLRRATTIMAILGGAMATQLNGEGVRLLRVQPDIIIGLIIGNILGVLLLRGIPVGPVAAGGITAILLSILKIGR